MFSEKERNISILTILHLSFLISNMTLLMLLFAIVFKFFLVMFRFVLLFKMRLIAISMFSRAGTLVKRYVAS